MTQKNPDAVHELANHLTIIKGRALKIKGLSEARPEISSEVEKMMTSIEKAIDKVEMLKDSSKSP